MLLIQKGINYPPSTFAFSLDFDGIIFV